MFLWDMSCFTEVHDNSRKDRQLHVVVATIILVALTHLDHSKPASSLFEGPLYYVSSEFLQLLSKLKYQHVIDAPSGASKISIEKILTFFEK